DSEESIKVSINVRSDNVVVDSSIAIKEEKKSVEQGEGVVAQVNINQIGNEKDLKEITVKIVIKDFEGNVYYEDTQVVEIFDEEEFLQNIPTDNLPSGSYVLGMEVSYPGAFETSSSQFKVEEEIPEIISQENSYTLILVISFALIIILILYFLFARRRKLRKF
ncbi:MAG: hypothetical protein QF460_03075, partial [Candidatus Nanoarchaeia archaeon]|nr:hypothetical protein [Candidatus Nanoarchaeia archaeon]